MKTTTTHETTFGKDIYKLEVVKHNHNGLKATQYFLYINGRLDEDCRGKQRLSKDLKEFFNL